MIEHSLSRALSTLLLGLSGTAVACASTRLDPNNHAFTFYAPTPSATASSAPSTIASTTPNQSSTGRAKAHTASTDPTAGTTAPVPEGPAKSKSPSCSSLPDPTPTRTDRWVDVRLQFDRGTLEVLGATEQRTRRPEVTPRKLGRFMLELWIGCELIDRVRFDFPLLAATPPKDGAREPNFESAAHFATTVRIPNSDRATRLELVDRANPSRQLFDWPLHLPPEHGKAPLPSSSGNRELSPKR